MGIKNIKVVIGANYGSEGKGMATDYLCSRNTGKTIVVLTNGGVQRGHTVETIHEDIAVFHSLGSGTLRGCDTYISEYFVLNPIMIVKEIYSLLSEFPSLRFTIYIDRSAIWSTQYDMILNQAYSYKNKLHNSTGFGVYETIKRYRDFHIKGYTSYTLEEFIALSDTDKRIYINFIFGYFIERLHEYGIKVQDKEVDSYVWETLGNNTELVESMVRCMYELQKLDFIKFTDSSILNSYDNIIFENGQGLLLDASFDREYGTSTNTGLIIPYKIIESLFSKQDIEVMYVSRSYLTRHGDGDLINELFTLDDLKYNLIFPDFDYEINENNEFQGNMRYAPLDLYDLVDRCKSDMERVCRDSKNKYSISIFITHMNECEIEENDMKIMSYTEDVSFYKTYGRTSEHIRQCNFWEE